MAAEWYYIKGGKQLGPVSQQDLQDMAASGGLKPTDLVWTDGMPEWIPASQVKQLRQSAAGPSSVFVPHPKRSAAMPPVASGGDRPQSGVLATGCKWGVLAWSVLCFGWAAYRFAAAFHGKSTGEMFAGAIFLLAIAFVAWVPVAIPLLVIWVVSGRR